MKPQEKEAAQSKNSDAVATEAPPLITVFSIPKPFQGHTGLIQRNAVKSWKNLGPDVDVILIGDEKGIGETADELGVHHVASIRRNEFGTPLVSSAFQSAHETSRSPILVYCNCDVILLSDFARAIKTLVDCSELESFVAIGRRTDLQVDEEIDFGSQDAVADLIKLKETQGKPAAIVCKEFFAFSRLLYSNIPEFAVGRGNWDNWMVASARAAGTPIVNIGPATTIIHQNHDYGHLAGHRLQCYATGAEARNNQKLAGGRNLVRGSSSTWILTKQGLRQKKLGWANLDFWSDTIPFVRLMIDLLVSRE